MPETIEAPASKPQSGEEYVSPDEAARRLGVNAQTIRANLSRGKLRGVKIGRVWRVQWPPQNL